MRTSIKVYTENPSHPSHPSHIANFCQLVRHYGADRQCLLSYEEIMTGLDDDDIACLETLDRHDKQVWTELLANRLTSQRRS